MNEKEFKPYIPADSILPEFTATSVVLGILLAIIFGGANAYLGLRVGMTVSASIPAAVVSMGIIRLILKRDSILENNMVQTIGSAGEALAGGAIFTLPVLFMWAHEGQAGMPSVFELCLICLCGGVLGITFMIPLRDSLIVKEHGTLPYPEGVACAEVLKAGEEGGEKSKLVFKGFGIASLYKFITDGLHIFPSEVNYNIQAYKGSAAGVDILPALAGVGYICGPKVTSAMLCGGLLSWFVLMPVIALFGSDLVLYPATMPVSEVLEAAGPAGLWSYYIRYIGAGAVLGGGLISMVKTMPTLVSTLKASFGKVGNEGSQIRTQQNLSTKVVLILTLAVALILWLVPAVPMNFLGIIIIIIFGFAFAAVTSRIVGMVGCNNNPSSSMTIATLIITCLVFKATGYDGIRGMSAAIAIACVICTISGVSGDTSQDLKTGFLLGATPKKQQIGELIGCLATSVVIGGILYLLDASWGFGSTELSAPQATLMRMVVEGVMGGNLPWTLIMIGVCISVIVVILGVPVLPFATGMYLPIHLSAGIMCGGLIRLLVDKRKQSSQEEHKGVVERGILYSSGLIAGEGIIGILLAVFAVIKIGDGSLGSLINLSGIFSIGQIGGIICFVLLLLSICKVTIWSRKK